MTIDTFLTDKEKEAIKMRKYMFLILMTCVIVLSMTYEANASLRRVEVPGEYVIIVDEDNGLMWADLSMFADMTYTEQQKTIQDMNSNKYAGAGNWAMASMNPCHPTLGNCFAEVACTFTPCTIGNPASLLVDQWYGRIDVVGIDPASHQFAGVWEWESHSCYGTCGSIADSLKQKAYGAWVSARYGEPAGAPEP